MPATLCVVAASLSRRGHVHRRPAEPTAAKGETVCSVCAPLRTGPEHRMKTGFLNRQNEVQQTQCSLFPICFRLPKPTFATATKENKWLTKSVTPWGLHSRASAVGAAVT